MKTSVILSSILAYASTALAGPIKRTAITDAGILNYALTLEHLEDKFYRTGIQNFTAADFAKAGFDTTFYNNLLEISFDETTHVNYLTAALKAAGATPVQECTYQFPVTDVHSFVATAALLEGVGVTAYLGAAASITSKAYLTAAGSILTIEARHTAYLNAALGRSPAPQPFDAPLDFNEVYSLAAPLIVSCPSTNPTFLPLSAFPAITVTPSNDPVRTGSVINISAQLPSGTGQVFASFVSVTGPVPATISPCNSGYQVTVPAGVHGQSYLVLTKAANATTDDGILAGPAVIQIAGTNLSPQGA